MENNWKAWIPHHDLENKYFICKVVDDEDGLQLFHISNDYTKKICVQFPGMVYAYRNRLELAALCTLDKIDYRNNLCGAIRKSPVKSRV